MNIKKILLAAFLVFSAIGSAQLIDPYRYAPVCTPDPNERYTTANAASDPNCNEANDTAGWGNFGGTSTIASVANDDPEGGAFKLVITTPDGTSSSYVYGIPGTETAGDTFTVTLRAKTNGGCDATITGWGNCTINTGPTMPVDVTTTWTTYTWTITATGNNVYIRAYPDGGGEGGCGAPNDTMEISVVSIIYTGG